MTRLTQSIAIFAGGIMTIDVLLMIINGTLFYVILTIVGFYIILSLSFKESFITTLKRWLNTGHFNRNDSSIQEVHHE
ncbi:hypothetical protein [Leuconostoc citreum]|uniref:hypothetical protein n=1 Tax=Leuconostoc citreum TaxID=33964 RepID=UPI0032DF7ED7